MNRESKYKNYQKATINWIHTWKTWRAKKDAKYDLR